MKLLCWKTKWQHVTVAFLLFHSGCVNEDWACLQAKINTFVSKANMVKTHTAAVKWSHSRVVLNSWEASLWWRLTLGPPSHSTPETECIYITKMKSNKTQLQTTIWPNERLHVWAASSVLVQHRHIYLQPCTMLLFGKKNAAKILIVFLYSPIDMEYRIPH